MSRQNREPNRHRGTMMRRAMRRTMRRAMTAAATVAVTAVLAGTGAAAAQTVKVGLILTYSGPDAAIGEQIDRGIKLYVKEHARNLPEGVTVEIVRRDDGGPNPDTAKRLAQELILREKVSILTGGQWTPNAMAMAALSREARIPLVVMAAGGSVVTQQSPYIVRTGFTLWQSSYPLGQWAFRSGLKKVVTVVSDFAPGLEGERAFSRGFTGAGGTIAGAIRVPLQTSDYLPFFQRAKDAAPDAIYVFNPGGPKATAFMKAIQDVGIPAAGIKLLGPGDITTDEELPNMGRAPLGVITAHHYSAAGDRPANAAFVAAWKKEYGAEAVPNYFSVGGWDGMKAIYDAVAAQKGKADPERTIALLQRWSNPDSPRGPIAIDPETRDIIQNEYIRRVEEVNGRLANVEIETIADVKDPWKEMEK